MTDKTNTTDEGLISSVKNITSTFVAIARTRLELLSIDIEEGWLRLISLLATAFVALFCLCFGVVLLAIFIIVLLWDTHRLLILGSLTGLFIIMGVLLYLKAARAFKSLPRLFESSIAELSKDQEQLDVGNKE